MLGHRLESLYDLQTEETEFVRSIVLFVGQEQVKPFPRNFRENANDSDFLKVYTTQVDLPKWVKMRNASV